MLSREIPERIKYGKDKLWTNTLTIKEIKHIQYLEKK